MESIYRRSVLLVGAGTLASMAGCSGGSEGGGDTNGGDSDDATTTTTTTEQPDTTEQPTTLALENTHLCAEAPSGYQQYSEQPEGTYDPGDVVWVYFEPSTVGTKSDTIDKTVPESADLSTVFLTVNFSPPTEFEGGGHTVEIEVTDAIAGTSASTSVDFEVDAGLQYTSGEYGIGTFAFTEEEASGYQEYTEKSEAEYGPTERVWYYYEIDGFAYEETSNALTHDLQITETLTGPEGEIWSQVEIPLKDMFEPDIDLDTYFVADYLAPSEEWMTGEYTIRLEVSDGLADNSVTERYTFAVVE